MRYAFCIKKTMIKQQQHKTLAIIGSTGSIGTQTLDIVRRHPKLFGVHSLVAHSSADKLVGQALEFLPKVVGIFDESKYDFVRAALPKSIAVVAEQDALTMTVQGADTCVASVVGMQGLSSVIAAIEAGVDVALANKESLVAGGGLVMELARRNKVKITPIDSEHSAVWQCLKSGRKSDLKSITLTASGGPFRTYTKEQLRQVTLQDALKHPTWAMGAKITIDSATMANKALEIIEARWLFGTTNIDYVIHPESIIHSTVEFKDGSVIAQMSHPTMEIPIQLAITYPKRFDTAIKRLDLAQMGKLTFVKPNEDVFIMPRLAKECLKKGGTAPAIFNAANEAANELFRNGKITFLDIMSIVERAVSYFKIVDKPTLENIYEVNDEVYKEIIMNYKV